LDWILDITSKNDAILDVGSGVSALADTLLEKNYQHLSLLEIANHSYLSKVLLKL
jgi:16S rRNA A1518/A1519 N6-dimethyltransferase RsmA/KsgA/DIM1 with predicted DNA glycosylase/AP lyase activity